MPNASARASTPPESGERRFAYIARRVEPDAKRRARALGIAGVYFQPEYHRFYPAGEVAAHLVGRTDIDDRGQEGIERAYNSVLTGEPGTKRVLRDLPGNTVKELLLASPEDGDDLFLGLDLRLQFYAHRELGEAIKRHKARSGSVVMVDVASGDVLALANQPSFNPNDWGARGVVVRNHALTDQFEPGSTVKPVTVLAALETGEYRGDTEIDTAPGWFRVGRKLIEDPLNRGVLTLAGVVAKSSQVGITKVALALEERAVFDALRRAGFGSSSITGLPEETAGFLTDRDLSRPIGRATIAYGYGLTVSAAQLAKVYLTLASGGVRRELNLLRDARPLPPERVFDAGLVADVVDMMRGVVAVGGTAPKARIPGLQRCRQDRHRAQGGPRRLRRLHPRCLLRRLRAGRAATGGGGGGHQRTFRRPHRRRHRGGAGVFPRRGAHLARAGRGPGRNRPERRSRGLAVPRPERPFCRRRRVAGARGLARARTGPRHVGDSALRRRLCRINALCNGFHASATRTAALGNASCASPSRPRTGRHSAGLHRPKSDRL